MPIDLNRWKKGGKETAKSETKKGGPSPLSELGKSVKMPSFSKDDLSKIAERAVPVLGEMAGKGAKWGVYGFGTLFWAVSGLRIPGMPDKPPPSSEPHRPMKFPYTFTAKVVQFPWVYYIRNNWVYRYYVIAVVVSFPIIKKIHGVFNSPANVKKWEEIKRKEREAEEHH